MVLLPFALRSVPVGVAALCFYFGHPPNGRMARLDELLREQAVKVRRAFRLLGLNMHLVLSVACHIECWLADKLRRSKLRLWLWSMRITAMEAKFAPPYRPHALPANNCPMRPPTAGPSLIGSERTRF